MLQKEGEEDDEKKLPHTRRAHKFIFLSHHVPVCGVPTFEH